MKKRIISILAALSLIFGATVTLGQNNVYAEGEDNSKPAVWLQISPVSNRVALSAGQALSYTFNVDNIGSSAFKFKVYAVPYSVTNESYEVNFSNENNRTQITRWIKFNQNEGATSDAEKQWVSEATFSVEPDSRKTIEYMISVPNDVPQGGQYATIFAESIPDSTSTSSGLRTISRVGLILYGHTTGETKEEASIHDYQINTFMTGGDISSKATVSNKGNTDFAVNYKFVVKKFFGSVAYDNGGKSYDVLPDTDRVIEQKWEDTPVLGIFRVTSTITALDQTFESTKIVLVIPLFIIIIMAILLTIIIVWLIILVKKRRAEKSRLIV